MGQSPTVQLVETKWKKVLKFKKILGFAVILFITFVLLETVSYFSFQLLTEQKFSYAAVHDEQLSRIDFIKMKLGADVESQALYVFHPYFGYVGRTGAYPWSKKSPPFNQFGMLSVEKHPYPYKKAEDEFVVAVVGGSVAEIFANQAEGSMNQYLHEKLGFKKKLVLINLATGGYKQPQQLFHLQYALLSGFEFDAVLNIDGFNDLVLASENISNGINPIFPSGYRFGLVAKNQSNNIDFQTSKQFYQYYSLYNRELTLLSFVHSFPFRYSPFLNLIGALWTKQNIRKVKKAGYELTVETLKTIPDEFRGPDLFNTQDSSYKIVTDVWYKSSEMLSVICQKNNLLYLHVLQPNQYVAGSKTLSEKEREIAIDPESVWGKTAKEGYSNLITMGNKLKSAGVPFYDLSMIFKDYKGALYVDSCCHFGPEGNLLMGREIANLLVKEIEK